MPRTTKVKFKHLSDIKFLKQVEKLDGSFVFVENARPYIAASGKIKGKRRKYDTKTAIAITDDSVEFTTVVCIVSDPILGSLMVSALNMLFVGKFVMQPNNGNGSISIVYTTTSPQLWLAERTGRFTKPLREHTQVYSEINDWVVPKIPTLEEYMGRGFEAVYGAIKASLK